METAHSKKAHSRRESERPAWDRVGVHAGRALLGLHIHDPDFVNLLFCRPAKVFSTGATAAEGAADYVAKQYLPRHGPAGP